MNELQIFKNNVFGQVRVVEQNNEPWFVAADICKCLDIGDTSKAIKRLYDDEKGATLIPTPGGNQKLNIVNEYGLYSLVLSSRKPETKEFKRWITHEVIPSIRKHGAYMTDEVLEQALTSPDFLIQLATELKAHKETIAIQAKQIEQDKPKVLFADSVASSHTSILVGELAKLIKQNGVDIGQNKLFAWLRDNGYLIKRKGNDYNMPTQKAMEMKLFEIKETSVMHADGHISISKTPKVTGKGQQYFVNKFLS